MKPDRIWEILGKIPNLYFSQAHTENINSEILCSQKFVFLLLLLSCPLSNFGVNRKIMQIYEYKWLLINVTNTFLYLHKHYFVNRLNIYLNTEFPLPLLAKVYSIIPCTNTLLRQTNCISTRVSPMPRFRLSVISYLVLVLNN